jgi:hypothetical protein
MEIINSATSIRVPWNKGKLVGQKVPFKLKEIWAIRVRLQIASRMSRAGAIQFGGGQQASSLRFGSIARARRLSRPEHGIAGAHPAAKDAEARALRKHRTHSGCSIGLDQEIDVEFRRFPIPKPNSGITAPVFPPIRPNC